MPNCTLSVPVSLNPYGVEREDGLSRLVVRGSTTFEEFTGSLLLLRAETRVTIVKKEEGSRTVRAAWGMPV